MSSPIMIDSWATQGWMRYPDSGGLSERGRAQRETVRLQAAEWFAQDMPVAEIARRLRVSSNAVYVWRRAWRAEGPAGLASKGPGGSACPERKSSIERIRGTVAPTPCPAPW